MVSSEALLAMKTMAADVKKRSALIKDSTCIGGLVLVLSNTDDGVVKLALETIQLLAECHENRLYLRDFIGMLEQLETLMNRSMQKETEQLARSVYELLSQASGEATALKTSNSSHPGGASRRRSSTQKSMMGGLKKTKTLILQLRGLLNKCDRDVCMRLLLQVKGVISITFDMNQKRCILRTKPEVRPESLVQVITKTQSISAQQVIKTDAGEEMFLSFGLRQQDLDKENADLPDYLPDEEEPEEIDDKAVARNKQGDEKSGSGWLSAAASFLTNSFYW